MLFKTFTFSGINHDVSVGNVNCHNTVDNRGGGGDKEGVTPHKNVTCEIGMLIRSAWSLKKRQQEIWLRLFIHDTRALHWCSGNCNRWACNRMSFLGSKNIIRTPILNWKGSIGINVTFNNRNLLKLFEGINLKQWTLLDERAILPFLEIAKNYRECDHDSDHWSILTKICTLVLGCKIFVKFGNAQNCYTVRI